MNDILKTYKEQFRENRHTLRRYTAFVLALAMITTLFVNWQLHGVGISMTAQYQCGEVEHAHTADCYDKVLICGYAEGELENADEVAAAEAAAASAAQSSAEEEIMPLEPQIEFVPHEHTDDCYTEVQTLTCLEEEHVHDDDCYDPEDGSLICEKFEHTHDESCYTTEYELTCGLEEGELVEQVVEPTQTAELVAMAVAEPVALEPVVDTVEPIYHHHTDACYEEVLVCPLPEHHHTVSCLSDTSADLETPEEWQAANAEAVLTGEWNEDLLSVAKTQLGYEQSEKNFEIDPADGVTLRYYSRYGQSYGNAYGEWDVMFLAYCLKYAEIPQSAIPQEASVLALRSSMSGMDWLLEEDGSAAQPGDIVIYNKYVTRTVAVDSSADGAADGLDDQFSMDAEGENGAALEESGAAALDTAPAAEDAPAADSVITPDLPDTANPEQPAAKPVDSTGTSASGTDTLIPSVVSPAAEPQTTTVTDAEPVETVGIVSEADENTLTVISGDVNGKVAEITLSNAEVLGVVDVSAAQYADTYGGQLPTISASRPNRAPTLMTTEEPTYFDYFEETPEGTNKGGITGITVKKGSQILEPGTSSIELMDGDKLSLSYTFNIPENALKDHPTPKTLTYKLPDGIELTENKDFKLINQSDENQEVGTGVVDTDGVVHLTFYNDFDTSKPFTGHFDFDVEASTVGFEESSEIHFPTGLDLLVKLPRDLAIEKKGATPVVDNDGTTYIDYTVIVSSKDGWSQPIEILDELQNNDTIAGEYVTGSFKLFKIDKDNTKTEIEDYQNHVTANSFHIENLAKLNSGESYRLTYRVKIIKNTAAGAGSVEFKNKARSNKTDDWKWWTTSFEDRIWKNGSYNPDTNTITWTVGVKNPYAQNLKGSTVVDTITTDGALINGSIKLEQVRDKDGSWITASIGEPFAPNADKKGFTYTFNEDACGMEYKFTYETTVPTDSTTGKPVMVHNDSTFKVDGKDYTVGKDVTPSDRSWGFSKSPTGNFTSTGEKNQYTAGWRLYSDVPNSWTTYDFVDHIKVSENVKHYGIALELESEIRKNLTFTTADNKTLTAADAAAAGIKVTIDYYTDSFDNASDADNHTKTSAANSTEEIHTFIIHLEKGKYTGSPVKSMNISSYYTHVDTTAVPAGAKINIYNNTASYFYNKNANETGLTKGVSTSNYSDHYYNKAPNPYKPTATEDYKSGMEVYYEIVLDVSSLKKFSKDKDGNYTITVTDTLPNGLTFKEGSATGLFGWTDWCQQNSQETGFSFAYTANFAVTREGQTITFKFNNLDKVQYELAKVEGKRLTHLLVRYAATVTDPKWESPKTVTGTYTNTAKWDGKDADATITLNRDLEYLTKSATYEALENEKGAKTGQLAVHYSLDINPACADLLKDGDTVTLTDTMAVQDKNVTAHLDMDSVKLYDYPYVKDVSQPLPTTSYGMVYERTTDSSGKDTHTMKFTLDDSRGYVLKYDYVLDSNDTVTLSNVAELTGNHRKQADTLVTKLDASGSVSHSQFTLYKVDSLNPLTRLKGAEFTLSSYNGTEFIAHDGQSLHKTDANGEIVLYLGQNEKDDHSGHFTIKPDTLYRLVETKAPDGYKIGTDDPVYFIFADADHNQTAAQAWEKTNKPNDLDQSKVVIVTGGQQKNYDVKNTRIWLTIQKFWQDKDGKAIPDADTPNTDVTVELYRYPDGGRKDSAEHVTTITLNKTEHWTYVFKDVKEGYYYFIKEASTGDKYDVTYSESNKTGVENGGLLTLTNKEIVGYELPSTGGTGTLPYTAVGGTMMLSALAYTIIHRKRRHEGRADD